MALKITRAQLLYRDYEWTPTKGDNPRFRNSPDVDLVNRAEGYEVLDFINGLLSEFDFEQLRSAHQIEKMLRDAPSDRRSRKHLKEWIKANWKAYQLRDAVTR